MRKNANKIILCILALMLLPSMSFTMVVLFLQSFNAGTHTLPALITVATVVIVSVVLSVIVIRQLFALETSNDVERQRSRESAEYHRYISEHDMLTNLHNKNYLQKAFNQNIKLTKKIALVFFDLDNFKQINDLMGHNVGDMLLRKVAEKLVDMRQDDEVISRVGGDEFVVLKPYTNDEEIAELGARIMQQFKEPFQIFGGAFNISASIGAASYPDNGWDFQEIYKNADTAMYEAKRTGKNMFRLFSPGMQEEILDSYETLKCVREYASYCFVEYQPIVDIDTGEIMGFESLIRMQASGKVIPPSEFIPVASKNGLLADIGNFVLLKASEFIVAMQKKGINVGYITVNISGTQFFENNFLGKVKDILDKTGVDPSKLMFELTEDVVIKYNETKDIVREIEKLGIAMGIDDFGTGYSSLNHLTKLSFNFLKIDKSFVDNIGSERDEKVIELIVGLANTLKMKSVAEGVEKKEQILFLRSKGCSRGQGYLFSKPLKADFIERSVDQLILKVQNNCERTPQTPHPNAFGRINPTQKGTD